jgi:hypothetical protein
MRTGLKVILLPGLLAAWLCCTNPAVADTVNAQDLSALDDGLADVPPADLAGWFLTFDPSSEWTSAANIATMESWLVLVEDLYAASRPRDERFIVSHTSPAGGNPRP